MGLSIQTAFKCMEHVLVGTKYSYTPKSLKNCKIFYQKTSPNSMDKIVERADGTKVTGHFWGDANGYELGGTTIENVRGRIARSYGAQNYDRVTQIETNKGDYLVRLAHSDRSGFIDTDHSSLPAKVGDFTNKLKNMIDYILG